MGEDKTEATILFADLSGFTALTEAHGDTTAADLLERFYTLALGVLTDGARIVKTIGDAVMVSAPTAAGALTASQFVFRPLGEVLLKNVHESCELFEVVDGEPSSLVEVDPVCRMRLDPLKALHRLPFEGRVFFFCSAGCEKKFAADPPTFATRR